jgi:predicted esterase
MLFLLALLSLDPGKIIDRVETTADPSQSYALYLPSAYSPDRAWPVVIAFDPGARGRVPVERFQAAAETYGYIVAGSNNSRNGSWERSTAAAQAMWADVNARFNINQKRVYATGFSGGSRVALGLASSSGGFAGVIACSAGFPEGKPSKSASFPIFGTAGSEDFNYLEMRQLDHTLTSPHRLTIFEGRHAWPPAEVATAAIEWMELQRRDADPSFIAKLFETRVAQAEALTNDKDAFLAWTAIVTDFTGRRDVSTASTRAAELGKRKSVKDALKHERDEEQREGRTMGEMATMAHNINEPGRLTELRDRLVSLKKKAEIPDDTTDRRIARRVLSGLRAQSIETEPAMRKLMDEVWPAPPRRP